MKRCILLMGNTSFIADMPKWVEFLQAYTFHIKHKAGKQNQVVDALSRRHSLLSTMQVKVLGFEVLKELYQDDPFFQGFWDQCANRSCDCYILHEVFLFNGTKLCIPDSSLREAIIAKAYGGCLAGHFGRDKTISLVEEHFLLASDDTRCGSSCGEMSNLSYS